MQNKGAIRISVKGVGTYLSYEKCKWITKNLLSILHKDGVDYSSSLFVFTAPRRASRFCVRTNVIWRNRRRKTRSDDNGRQNAKH